eukprot:118288_1
MSTTKTNATTTTTTTEDVPAQNQDAGANFRTSNPIQPTKTEAVGEASALKETGTKPSADTKDTQRFGIAGKPVPKVSFRILSNLSLLFKPYGGLSKPNEFCIKPGGVEGTIKPFTSSSGRKQFKKVGIRISYTIKQLLSIRHKFKSFPSDLEVIPLVLVEGLGDFETLTAHSVTLSSSTLTMSPSKLRKSKLKSKKKAIKSDTSKTASPQTVTTAPATATPTTTYSNSARYDGNDDDASFRDKKTVTPSKINVSKLKKRDKPISPPTETVTQITREETVQQDKVKEPPKELRPKPKIKEEVSPSSHTYIAKNISSTQVEQVSTKPKKSSVKPLSSFRSQGAWGRGRKILDPMAQFTAKITIRLNKITMDNFNTLSDQLIGIYTDDITNTEQLTKLVTLIFEKTVQEHVYGPLYAKLCVALSAKNKSFDEVVMTSGGKKETRQVDFKNVLVKVCQKEFQKGKRKTVFTSDMDKTDRDNEEIKQKKILLGTMKFIGQLYLKQLIPSKIMIVCLEHLVGGMSGKPTEDDIEGACTLIETVGKTLDEDQSVNSPELRKYYQKLESIERNSSKYSPRIRILIQNLIDLRKNGWKGLMSAKEKPRALSQKKNTNAVNASTIYDPFDEQIPLQLNMAQFAMGADDAVEMITGTTVPISSHVVGQSQRKFRSTNRYSKQKQHRTNTSSNQTKKNTKQIYHERSTASGNRKGKGRKLLEIEDEEEMYSKDNEQKQAQNTQQQGSTVSAAGIQIGRRKERMALSSSSKRPCDEGKSADEEVLSDLCGDYLYNRNNMNIDNLLTKLIKYEIKSRTKFVLRFIQKAVDGGKGERLADIIPRFLNEYVLIPQELDVGFVEFFKGYTMEDNPQISSACSQLLAPLIVDNELNFTDVLEWILLDTREKQPQDDMLQYYDGDGVRNYIRKSKSITKAMELLGCLLKELKDSNFEDSQYVPKLVVAYDFKIDRYINKKDVANKEEIRKEWISKYGIQFAF